MAVTTSSGNGFALYNGVKLPNIDSVWTDKVTRPVCVISNPSDNVYYVWLGTSFGGVEAGGFHIYGGLEQYAVNSDNQWVLVSSKDGQQYIPFIFSPWVPTDVINSSGDVVLAASDPIPLDGMNVIEWDGDTTGLVSSSADTHYKVSDVVLSASDLVGSVIAVGSEALVVPAEFITNGEGYASIDTIVLSCQNEGVSFDGDTLPEKGLYFINAFDVHLPFFAYPASGGDSGDDEGDDGGDTSTTQKHYCRVNGSVHEVEGGTARVKGSYHEIEVGTVRIEGAYYEIPFSGGSEGGGEEGGGSLDGVIFQAGEGLLQGTVTATPNNPSFTSVISYSVTDSYITTTGGNVQQTVGGNTVYIPAFYTLTIGSFDATDYDTLHVELTSNIGVIKCESGTDSVASGVITNSSTAEEVTLDISGLSGDCNVVIAPSGNITSSTIFNATIYKIWLT